jgi:hypothetical protein
LHERVCVSEFVVVEGEVGLDRGVFQEFVARVFVVSLLEISQAQVEVRG